MMYVGKKGFVFLMIEGAIICCPLSPLPHLEADRCPRFETSQATRHTDNRWRLLMFAIFYDAYVLVAS